MEPLKNLISPELVGWIATHLARHLPGSDREGFERSIIERLHSLELKQRAQLIADHLHAYLPADLPHRFAILRAMLHPVEDTSMALQSDDQGLRGWAILPLCAVVGQHGQAEFDAGLDLLKDMTSRFSAEFDVRHFILADQGRALARMTGWIADPNRHVRRLVSEGTRPRLPWAMQLPALIADPAPILPLLTALRDDGEDYVRRSVANSLNDIAKDHPDLVAEIARQWMQDASPQREKLLRHACRTLIKQGHPAALMAFGISTPKTEILSFAVSTPHIRMGQSLGFALTLRSTAEGPQSVILDYVLQFRRANGSASAKVFKWKNLVLAPHQTLVLSRLHPIRKITTRRYYPGQQSVSLRINGQDSQALPFTLDV